MFYFSYASNLNRAHMARLCPWANPLFPAVLEDHTLTVRRWFNVEPEEGAVVHGGVWEIGESHLPALDLYEDCPELYERKFLPVIAVERGRNGDSRMRGHGDEETRGKISSCLVYIMKEPFAISLSQPDPEYLELVREGYRQWGLSPEQLDPALMTATKPSGHRR